VIAQTLFQSSATVRAKLADHTIYLLARGLDRHSRSLKRHYFPRSRRRRSRSAICSFRLSSTSARSVLASDVSCPSRSSLATSLRCFATCLSPEATRASACSKCCSNTSRSIGPAATLSCRPSVGLAAAVGRPAEFARPLEGDRPSPPPFAASPPPTATERRASARSPWRMRRQNMIWHDADIRLP
jgi:hypothetical protein